MHLLIVNLITMAISLTTLGLALIGAVKIRSLLAQLEKDAARATRITAEDSGSYAKLVSIGEHGCDTPLPERQGNRPTHPDGTPYRYHEIVAEGWGHCDGCHQWGQWTIKNPHECKQDIRVTVAPIGDPAEVGRQVGRILRRHRGGDF